MSAELVGFQLVLAVLRGECLSVGLPIEQWHQALDAADQHGVLGLFIKRARLSVKALPETILERIACAERSAALASFLYAAELRCLLKEFAETGIQVLPLKGPWLAQRIYGHVALRPSRDLDLLVPWSDFRRSERILERCGFSPCDRRDDYHRKWRRASTFVELHFQVANPIALDFDLHAAWQRAQCDDFQGVPAWRFAPDDEFLYLCLHAIRHRFDRLGLICDLSLFLKKDPSVAITSGQGRSQAQQAWLALGLAMVAQLEPATQPLPATQLGHLALGRLASRLWDDLPRAQAKRLDWKSQHRFYLELIPGRSERLLQRLAHLRIAATRLIGEDYRFADRLGFHQPWQAWMLRPVRLLSGRKHSFSVSRAETPR